VVAVHGLASAWCFPVHVHHIIACANLKTDLLIVFVGICGGLAIEILGHTDKSLALLHGGTTAIVDHPAWPIASLSLIAFQDLWITDSDDFAKHPCGACRRSKVGDFGLHI